MFRAQGDRIYLGDVATDLNAFDAACGAALTSGDPVDVLDAMSRFRELARDVDASWLHAERERVSSSFRKLVRSGLSAARSQGQAEKVLEIAETALRIDPTSEDYVSEVLRAHIALRTPQQGFDAFQKFRRILASELDSSPSEAILRLADDLAAQSLDLSSGTFEHELVGRHAESNQLRRRLVRTATSDKGWSASVIGEPGIGKTAVLEAASRIARSLSFSVLSIEHAERSSTEPYAGIKWTLARSLTEGSLGAEHNAFEGEWLRVSEQVLPDLKQPGSTPRSHALQPIEEVWRQREAIVQVTLAHSLHRPLLLIADDVHWADNETLAVLARLRALAPSHPIVVLEAQRPHPMEPQATNTNDSPKPDSANSIVLTPLSASDSRLLLKDFGHPNGWVDAVTDVAKGNPFFLLELGRAGPAQLPDPRSGTTSAIDSFVRRCLAGLSSHAQATATAMAVIDAPVTAEFLSQVMNRPIEDTNRGLAELQRFFVAHHSQDRWQLKHQIYRSVSYSASDPEVVQAHHEAAARLLQDPIHGQFPVSWSIVADHYRYAGDADSEFTALVNAADSAASLQSPATAATNLSKALKIQGAGVSPQLKCKVLLRLSRHLATLGDAEREAEVLAVLANEIDNVEETATRERLLADLAQARIEYLIATSDFEAALDALARADGELLRSPHLRERFVGRALHLAGRSSEAIDLLRSTLPKLDRDSRANAETLVLLGSALWSNQDFAEANEVLTQALDLCTRSEQPRTLVDVLGTLATLAGSQGDHTRAISLHARAVDTSRLIGYRRGEAINTVNQATTFAMTAQGGDAYELYNRAESLFESIDERRGIAFVRLNRADLRLWLFGDTAGARADAADARSFFKNVDDKRHLSTIADINANIARVDGKFRTANNLADEAIKIAQGFQDGFLETQALRTAARVALEAEMFERALAIAQRASRLCEEQGYVHIAPLLDAIESQAAWFLGDRDRSLSILQTIVDRDLTNSSLRHDVAWLASATADLAGHPEQAILLATRAVGFMIDSLRSQSGQGQFVEPSNLRTMRQWLGEQQGMSVVLDVPVPRSRSGNSLGGFVRVEWAVLEPGDALISPAPVRRRTQLRRLIRQAHELGAMPRQADYAKLLNVSESTIKRDFAAIRRDAENQSRFTA